MGLPVVTLAGNSHVSRVGESLLTNVGLPQFIAQSPADYIRIAVDLAQNRKLRDELRAGLRSRMLASPLMNGPQFARNVESAYREMWQIWCGAGAQ
jgi:predicted O-linked N-acetylglucosamine transferase (SPINDLY family)